MRHKLLLLFLIFISGVIHADDIQILFDRIYNKALTLPTDTEIKNVLSLLQKNGSFSDIDYTDVSFSNDLSRHLDRINKLASAFRNSKSTYYNDASIKENYYLGLDFWVTTNHKPGNWWYRHIAYPRSASPGVALMGELMKTEKPDLFDRTMNYLLWAYLQNNYMTGANGADKIMGAYIAPVLKKDVTQLQKMRTQMIGLLQFTNGEGIEADMMFGQHSANGRQLYTGTYGGAYITSIFTYLTTVYTTAYDVTPKEITMLENLFLQGVQWMIYGKHIDPNQNGRRNSSTAGQGQWIAALNDFTTLNSPGKKELQTALDLMKNGLGSTSKPLNGNKMYWRFDYMLQRGSNYFATTRMTSKRTVGVEGGNGEGTFNYYGGAGVNYIFRNGNEYTDALLEDNVFNFRKYPGITAEQDTRTLPVPTWGSGGTNNTTYAGGVTSGNAGACGMQLDKRSIKANKSWFYFNDEFVALGSGIVQTDGTDPVVTTINQCVKYSDADYMDNQTQNKLTSGNVTLSKPQWVIQDQVGYFNLDNTSTFELSISTKNGVNIFTAGIDHGKNPTDKTYAYLVKPGITSIQANPYYTNPPVQILQNSASIQAVKHKALRITEIVFYMPSTLNISGAYTIEAKSACVTMLKETGDTLEISIANPRCESSNPISMDLLINKKLEGTGSKWDGKNSTLTFNLPQGTHSGETVTQKYYVDKTTTIEEHSKEEILLYPNPVQQNVYIQWNKQEPMTISIYNSCGTLVSEMKTTGGSLYQADLSKQVNGIYFIRISGKDNYQTRKIIVEH